MDHNHMLLPPPLELVSNAKANANNLTNLTSTDPTQHNNKSHQHLQPSRQQHQAHSALSPPYSVASPFYSNTTLRSSSSPRPLGPVPSCPPPSYSFTQQFHDPATLNFPEPPLAELAPLQLNAQFDTGLKELPSLASWTGTPTRSRKPTASSSAARETSYSPPQRPPWPSGNPLTVYYDPSHALQSKDSPGRMDIDGINNGARGPASPGSWGGGRASSVNLDDPDVRMAAEALGDLRADFVSSPQNKNTPVPISPRNHFGTPGPPQTEEPLLSLVMTQHPFLAKTIEGTTSAYNTSKNFSPRIKSGVEYVEGFVTPIASTVGSVGRVTGLEEGVRWFLRGNRRHQSSSDLESGEDGSKNKRRKVDNRSGPSSLARREPGASIGTLTSANQPDRSHGQMDPYGFAVKDRRLSMSTIDSLPAYDDHRSPAYTEKTDQRDVIQETDGDRQTTPTQSSSRESTAPTPTAWQSRLILSTSGLSIAMSEESLRSLKYCLTWLRWANEHIGRIIGSLKDSLEKFEPQHQISLGEDHVVGDAPHHASTLNDERARQELGARISALRSDVVKTLHDVIDTVSKYAGGALPDNARNLVRRHLTSFPQRFRLATQNSAASENQSPQEQREGKEKEMREGAQLVLVLAKEGLDMMAQVSGVLDGTIVSAEEWCERLGKKKREEKDETMGESSGTPQEESRPVTAVPFTGVGVDGDVKMG